MCRLAQLGLPMSKAGTTCCLRAANVRPVLDLPEDYAGNATTDVCSELPAKELLGARVGAVAGRLRRDLLATRTAEKVQARGAFFRGAQKMRQRVRKRFDDRALTFIISSWSAPWDAVDFGAGPPCAFDHGAIAPVVCVFVRRPQNDGVNVYVSLRESAGILVRLRERDGRACGGRVCGRHFSVAGLLRLPRTSGRLCLRCSTLARLVQKPLARWRAASPCTALAEQRRIAYALPLTNRLQRCDASHEAIPCIAPCQQCCSLCPDEPVTPRRRRATVIGQTDRRHQFLRGFV